MANIRKRPTVYFSIDTDEYPYKGVKGEADAVVYEDPAHLAPIVERITAKYLGTLDHPPPKDLVGMAKNGMSVVLELTPRYYSTWDFAES